MMFSDGIRPGGDLTEPPTSPGSGGSAPSLVRPPHRRTARIGRADRSRQYPDPQMALVAPPVLDGAEAVVKGLLPLSAEPFS